MNKVEKERKKRKFVKAQKAKIRQRNKRPKKRKYVIVQVEGVSQETMLKLMEIAKKKHTSVPKLVAKYVKEAVAKKCLDFAKEE